jgi:hypothetical protein
VDVKRHDRADMPRRWSRLKGMTDMLRGLGPADALELVCANRTEAEQKRQSARNMGRRVSLPLVTTIECHDDGTCSVWIALLEKAEENANR